MDKEEGYLQSTIQRYAKLIRTLGKTVNLFDAETVTHGPEWKNR